MPITKYSVLTLHNFCGLAYDIDYRYAYPDIALKYPKKLRHDYEQQHKFRVNYTYEYIGIEYSDGKLIYLKYLFSSFFEKF